MKAEKAREIATWCRRWQHVVLPVFAETVAAIANLGLEQTEPDPAQLAEVTLLDPVYTIQVLRVVNATPRGRFSAPVVSVSDAALLYGPRRFAEQFTRFPQVGQQFPSGHVLRQRFHQLSRQARLAGLLAAEWGRLRLDMRVEELQLAAMLHPLLDWLFWYDNDLQQSYKRDMAAAEQGLADLKHRIGGHLVAELIQAWKLPEPLLDLVPEHRQDSSRAHCVRLAVELTQVLHRGLFHHQVIDVVERTATALKVGAEMVWPAVRRAMLAEARRSVANEAPAVAWVLPLLPAPWPDELPAPSLTAETTSDNGPAPVSYATAVGRVMADGLQRLRDELHLQRVVLLTPGSDRQRLRVRHAGGDNRWKDISVPMAGDHLFARLMGRTQTFWCQPANAAKARTLLPPTCGPLLGADWFVGSICLKTVPFAIIVAERTDGPAPDANAYRHFQRVVADLAERLGKL